MPLLFPFFRRPVLPTKVTLKELIRLKSTRQFMQVSGATNPAFADLNTEILLFITLKTSLTISVVFGLKMES